VKQVCWCCGCDASDGFTVTLLVSSIGIERIQKSATMTKLCRKCGNFPGSRRGRRKLWKAVKDKLGALCGVIDAERPVLTEGEKSVLGT
jgi:hypothetical protein